MSAAVLTELLEALAALAQPWAERYHASDLLQFGVTAGHIASVALGALVALAADRTLLRLRRRPPAVQQRVLAELPRRHRQVVAATTVAVLTGVLLLLSDVRTLLPSPAFAVKMLLFALLLANGALLREAARRVRAQPPAEPQAWERLEAAALRSAGLWVALVLFGLLLTTVD